MGKTWQPVEDGDLHSFLAVQDNGETVAVFVNDDYGYAEEALPDGVRICRLVNADGVAVPSPEVVQTIRYALTTIKRAKSYELVFAESEEQWSEIKSDVDKHDAEIDAALAWLQQEGGGGAAL